ncbi:MAG: hypothetical protein OXN21_03660 [Chloroflexota bacterium]|nr:hypothetical protein [Chloroflexota bacterium]MDE2842461.1 hypothetical protein [Chloroflexota bacterium]
MQLHFHGSEGSNQDGVLDRLNRRLGNAIEWLSGPAMSEQERFDRVRAEVQSDKYGYGIL